MLVQTDVTPRVELENKLADLTDAQLSMLEQLFPRHIIEYMLARVPSRGGRNLRELANMHEQVMVLFCDVSAWHAALNTTAGSNKGVQVCMETHHGRLQAEPCACCHLVSVCVCPCAHLHALDPRVNAHARPWGPCMHACRWWASPPCPRRWNPLRSCTS